MSAEFPPRGSSPADFEFDLEVDSDHEVRSAVALEAFRFPLEWDKAWTPALRTEEKGYWFTATTQWWRNVCARWPCAIWLDWIGYANAKIDVKIDGQDVVIHVWKGWCQQFLPQLSSWFPGFSFPGGIGAEVGIYTYVKPPKEHRDLRATRRPPWPIEIASALASWKRRFQAHATSKDAVRWWWPASNAVVRSIGPVSFTLTEPESGDAIIKDYTTESYWTCKWMERPSFEKWRAERSSITRPLGVNADEYRLTFSVAGVNYLWAESTSEIVVVP